MKLAFYKGTTKSAQFLNQAVIHNSKSRTNLDHCCRLFVSWLISCRTMASTSDHSTKENSPRASKEEAKDDKAEKPKIPKDSADGVGAKLASAHVTRGNKALRETRQEEVNKVKEKFLKMKQADKRKLYKCGEKFTVLDDVQIWPEHFNEKLRDDTKMSKWWTINKKHVAAEVNDELNSKMSLFCGDITTLEIDAIANAANESLLGGGGVDGAIHAASGPHLRSECELLHGCDAGDAKISCGYKLPAKYVVHTVGPRGERPEVLERCYRRSLNLLKENNLTSIAFPCISTGIFGYPNLNAAKVALGTIRKWLEEEDYAKNVERIIMCLFLKKDIEIYDEQMQLFFPLDRSQKDEGEK